jgi:hypothetical protein
MKGNDEWKTLFGYALERLTAAKIPETSWSFGGGTVLMLKFNHRMSKDIDIFFRDPQFLNAVSPRINDASEEKIQEYAEHTQFTKITFTAGEVDFIVAPQISNCKPFFEEVCGKKVCIDNPVEIIAKKINFRADEFKPRDIFDLAVVYHKQKDLLIQNSFAFESRLRELKKRIADLADSGLLKQGINFLTIAPAGEEYKDKAFAICQDFFKAVAK